MIFGKYQLLELLGKGGMAEVFKAKSYGVEGFEKLLVIKRILSVYSDNEEFVEMFVNEAKIAVSLNHANVVQIYDLGKAGDSYFIAMEYVQGVDLSEILDWCHTTEKQLPLEAVIHIICEIAKGLDYAHRKKDQDLAPLNIIHRDISPQNVLISSEGEVKITDFGIARALHIVDSDSTSPVKGKFAYMAPEQAIAAPHDKRADIFSTGIVFYELLTGINPLKELKPVEILKTIQSESFPNFSFPCCNTGEPIPGALAQIINKATASAPDDRYESAAELYEDLITYSYKAGLRTGANSLAEFVAPLIELKENEPESLSSSGLPSVRSKVSSIYEDPSNITSVRRPSKRELAQLEDKSSIQLSTTVKDVTLLTFSFEDKTTDVRKLDEIIEQFGGILLENESGNAVFAFGIHVASDALTTAANTAWSIRTAMNTGTLFHTEGIFGMSLLSVPLHVEDNGIVKLTEEYKNAVIQGIETASAHYGKIVINGDLEYVLSRQLDCEALSGTGVPPLFKINGKLEESDTTQTKLIGRRKELKVFGELLAAISNNGGRVLALTGPAGVGKSRILFEVKRRLSAGGHNTIWFEASCSPWSRQRPYATILSLLQNIVNIQPLDTPEVIAEKIENLKSYHLSNMEFSTIKKLITGRVVEQGALLKSALVRIIRTMSQKAITIVVVDNLTAIDDESLDILHALSQRISDVPVLLTVTIRLGYIHGFEDSPIFTQTDIPPLCDEEMEQLVAACIESPSPKIVRDILSVSANIPQFAEETIAVLNRYGTLEILEGNSVFIAAAPSCPMVIRDIINSELYALPRDRRTILRMASCLGEQFDSKLLALLINRPVEELIPVLQMLTKVKLLSQIGINRYQFPTPYVQEAVYFSIESSDKQLIHRTIAQKIEQEYPGELDNYSEELAIHYLKSNAKKAAYNYLITAAQNTAVAMDHEKAVTYYLHALDLTLAGIGSYSKFELYEQLVSLAPQTTKVPYVLDRAFDLKKEIDTEPLENKLALEAQEALLLAHLGSYGKAKRQLMEVIASQEGTEREMSKTYLAMVQMDYGYIGEAKKILYRLALRHLDDLPPISQANFTVCIALSGQTDKALKRIEKHSPTSANAPISILYLLAEGHCLFIKKRFELATEAYTTALAFAKEQKMARETALLYHQLALCYLELDNFKQAFDNLRSSINISTEIEFHSLREQTQVCLSYIDAVKFNNNEALTQLLDQDSHAPNAATQIITSYCLAKIFLFHKRNAKAKQFLQKTQERMMKTENRFLWQRTEHFLNGL